MPLTPAEVHNVAFKKPPIGKRGYDEEEVDAFLLEVSDEVVESALARPDAPNLDRGSHRESHLDRIEKALAQAGYV